METPKLECDYTKPGASPEVRSRTSSPEITMNTSHTSAQGIPPSLNCSLTIPNTNLMVGTYIRLPTFNGNEVEDLEQHWFLCEPVWTVFQVQNEDIRKAWMITTLQGHALYWFMKFFIVPK